MTDCRFSIEEQKRGTVGLRPHALIVQSALIRGACWIPGSGRASKHEALAERLPTGSRYDQLSVATEAERKSATCAGPSVLQIVQ